MVWLPRTSYYIKEFIFCSNKEEVIFNNMLRSASIVRKEISTPHFKIIPPITGNRSSQVFLINRNATAKLSSVNNIHVKQQRNVSFFIVKFALKYMLVNVYINKIHARQCLCIISLHCKEGFSHPFNFLVVSKGILHV